MKIFDILFEQQNSPIIDNNISTGIGATGYSQDIDYFGKRMKMKPSIFLKLTSDTGVFKPDTKSVEYLRQKLRFGKGIGSPFLIVKIPDGWFEQDFSDHAKVSGHEGRNRMYSILDEFGDVPVETHLVLRGKFEIRARHIEDEWIKNIKDKLESQFNSKVIHNPFS